MLIYDGAELTRIANKVLGKDLYFLDHSLVNNHERSTEPVKLPFFFLGLGFDETQKWIETDIVGCLQSFFYSKSKRGLAARPRGTVLGIKTEGVMSAQGL